MKTKLHKQHHFLTAIAIGILAICPSCQVQEQQSMWPKLTKEINYPSSADSTLQPAMFYKPEKSHKPVPLLVGLHTWSGQYKQNLSIPYAKWYLENKWVFIHPHFRGPNRTTQATGSELVIADHLFKSEFRHTARHQRRDKRRPSFRRCPDKPFFDSI